jgi:hypothetical protein
MNASTSNRPDEDRASIRGVNTFAIVALGLLVLTATLFYGPIFFFLLED